MVEVTVLLIFPQRQWVDKVLVTNPSGHSPAFVERWLRQKKKKVLKHLIPIIQVRPSQIRVPDVLTSELNHIVDQAVS